MCLDPVTLGITASQMAAATAAISAAGAVAQHQSASAQASAQADAVNKQRAAERSDAERIQMQNQQEATAQVNAHALQATREMAMFDAIAGENGGGVTADRKAASMSIQQGQDMATLASNAANKQGDIALGDIASGTRASSQLASIKQPSLIGTGLTIASAGMGYSNKLYDIKHAKGT